MSQGQVGPGKAVKALRTAIQINRQMGILRTGDVKRDLGIWYVQQLWNAELAPETLARGWDLTAPDKRRLHVLSLFWDKELKTFHIDADLTIFDAFVLILLDPNFGIRDLYAVPSNKLRLLLKLGKDRRAEFSLENLQEWTIDLSTLPGYEAVAEFVHGASKA